MICANQDPSSRVSRCRGERVDLTLHSRSAPVAAARVHMSIRRGRGRRTAASRVRGCPSDRAPAPARRCGTVRSRRRIPRGCRIRRPLPTVPAGTRTSRRGSMPAARNARRRPVCRAGLGRSRRGPPTGAPRARIRVYPCRRKGRATRRNSSRTGSYPKRERAWKMADFVGGDQDCDHPDDHDKRSVSCSKTSS